MFKKALFIFAILSMLLSTTTTVLADKPTGFDEQGNTISSTSENGFDEAGYNRTARIFSGTYGSWCMDKIGNATTCQNDYGPWLNDKLIMKWNDEWDRGNAENWSKPPYNAWLNNISNGKLPGGSGETWMYKYVWIGPCGANYAPLPDGGYCIWGQFEVIMDKGNDGSGVIWYAHSTPSGYGANFQNP